MPFEALRDTAELTTQEAAEALNVSQAHKEGLDWVPVKGSPAGQSNNGFGMLKSRRAAVPADFDPAVLLKR